MTIDRVRIELTGGPGGDGVTTMYFLDGAAAQPAVLAFALAWSGALPDDVTLHVADTGDTINAETGELTGVWNGGDDGGYVGTSPDPFIAGSGMRIRWLTAGIVAGRRVSGSTFLVPLAAGIFTTAGVPSTMWVDNFLTAANALIADTAGNMVVWSRPTGSRVGSSHPVVSAAVPVQSSYLTSRRH